MMQDDRILAETVVATDFFGPDGLTEDAIPPAPEKYTIARCLGRGGGGAVYLAEDTTLGRPVALKYLSHARPADLERFFREARFAARLNNPSIVQVYEVGEVEGLPFIAMQYIAGGNLGTANLDLAATLRIMRQIADALAHAHDEGIVHRDIKPENILLDADAQAYVTDFGIARDLRAELGPTISQDGQILGTPALMAPEQARGDVHAVDARSDVYALGATLYMKLTGHAPFEAAHVVDLLHAVIHQEPPFPRRYRAEIPRDVEAIILRCLRKRREDRFASMREVIEALDRSLSVDGGPVLSPVWFASYVRSRVDEAPAAAPDAADSGHDWLPALEVAQEIAAWDTQLYRVSGDLMRYFPRLDNLIARLDRVLAENPAIAWARFYRGVAWFRRGELRRAIEDMERSIDRVRDLASAYFELGKLYLATYLVEDHAAQKHLSRIGAEGHLHLAQSRVEQAKIAFEEARRLKQDLPGWQIRYAEAVSRFAAGDYDGSVAICNAILDDDPDLEEAWKLRGDALQRAGHDPLPSYIRALDIRRSYYEAPLAIAEVHLQAGRREEARTWLARALELHSGLTAARVLMARTYLPGSSAPGPLDTLRKGLEQATHALDASPDRYDTVVTLAEFQIEMARAACDASWIGGALETLARAERLEGCQNRVQYLCARSRVERARIAIATGDDPRADLDAVLSLRNHEAAHVPDNRPWLELLAEADSLLQIRESVRAAHAQPTDSR